MPRSSSPAVANSGQMPRRRGGPRRREPPLGEEGRRPARIAPMKELTVGLVAFVGRVLFASIFLLSAYQDACEFGFDGGPAAKALEPKFNIFVNHLSTKLGIAVPHLEIKTVVAVTLCMRVFGAGFFILYSRLGAFLLVLYVAFISIVQCDFYNYERGSPQYFELHKQFGQNFSFYGALLFFWGMKNSIMEEVEEEQQRLFFRAIKNSIMKAIKRRRTTKIKTT